MKISFWYIIYVDWLYKLQERRVHHGRDRMVVGFIIIYESAPITTLWVQIPLMLCVLDTTLWDKEDCIIHNPYKKEMYFWNAEQSNVCLCTVWLYIWIVSIPDIVTYLCSHDYQFIESKQKFDWILYKCNLYIMKLINFFPLHFCM